MQQLAEAGIERRIILVMPQRGNKLLGTPGVHRRRRRQILFINVNHAGIGRAKFVHMLEGVGVNFLRDFQAVAARFREADEFLQPGGAGGLEVDAGVEFLQRLAHRLVNGKLVAAGMHAQFERRRQAVLLDSEGNDREVFVEFLLELRKSPT